MQSEYVQQWAKARKLIVGAAASVMVLMAAASPALAFQQPVEIINDDVIVDVEPSQNPNHVDYWCTEKGADGVKFDTGAVGTHVQAPITIEIVDETPTRVSTVTGAATQVPYKVIVKGGSNGGDGYGNAVYTLPTTDNMIAPQPAIEVGRVSENASIDISHVIVCYRTITVDDVVTDNNDDEEEGETPGAVLGANTDDNQDQDDGEVQGVETLAETGVPAAAVSAVGFTTLGVAYILMRSSKVTEE